MLALRSTLARHREVVVIVGRAHRIRAVAGATRTLFNRSRSALVGRRIIDLVRPDDVNAVRALIAACRKNRRHARGCEVLARDRDIWYAIEPFGTRRKDDPRRQEIVLRVTNITDRRRAEDALRKAAQMLRTLTEASPLAILVEDTAGRLHLWNGACERLFGWNAAEVLGRPNPTISHEAAQDHCHFREQVLRRRNEFRGLESERIAKDGSRLYVSICAATVFDSSDRVAGIMEIITDITERKALEAQLLQAQKMEGIGRLAGGIAHDFNNMLTAVLGHTNLMLRTLNCGDAAGGGPASVDYRAIRSGIEQIQLVAERASQMVGQLLAFSRKQMMQAKIVDLKTTIAGMREMLQTLAGEDVDLRLVLPVQGSLVKVDPSQIAQVLMNLVVNARDAMPHGGKLTIEVRDAELSEHYARRRMVVVPGSYVLLAVSDNGHGMDKNAQSRIFEPFYTTKPPGKGTGLGLSTAYGIVKQSGGYIWCYSEPGVGTTFKIYLPSVARGKPQPEAGIVPLAGPSGSETVLLVEDEEIVRSLVRQALGAYGYHVLEACNGEAALEITSRYAGAIDVLISDLVMPGMSGLDLTAELVRCRPMMKVLYMSGYTEHAAIRNQLLDPDVPFISKPFSPDRLAHKVREVLGNPAARLERVVARIAAPSGDFATSGRRS